MDPLQTRKTPKQTRSKIMVKNILEASIRILRELPFEKFTTNRVAERAGISVGSLYQYFPNKKAILYELEKKAINHMIKKLKSLLFDNNYSAEKRMYNAIEYFFVTESSFYEIPSSSEMDYSDHLKEIKETMNCFLRKNGYVDKHSGDFLADYLVTFISSMAEQVGLRKDRSTIKLWIQKTFDTVMKIIEKN